MLFIPPLISDFEGKLVFLAGPIQGSADWQSAAIQYFNEIMPELHIASPRRAQWESDGFKYEEQVNWETYYLNKAHEKGGILFWLAAEEYQVEGRSYAQTTRFELGEWKAKHELYGTKMVVGIDKEFTNARYIRLRLTQDCPKIPLCDDLKSSCLELVRLLQ